jgi:hypothetical protein
MRRYYVLDEQGLAVRWFFSRTEAERYAAWEDGWKVEFRQTKRPKPEELVGLAPF